MKNNIREERSRKAGSQVYKDEQQQTQNKWDEKINIMRSINSKLRKLKGRIEAGGVAQRRGGKGE